MKTFKANSQIKVSHTFHSRWSLKGRYLLYIWAEMMSQMMFVGFRNMSFRRNFTNSRDIRSYSALKTVVFITLPAVNSMINQEKPKNTKKSTWTCTAKQKQQQSFLDLSVRYTQRLVEKVKRQTGFSTYLCYNRQQTNPQVRFKLLQSSRWLKEIDKDQRSLMSKWNKWTDSEGLCAPELVSSVFRVGNVGGWTTAVRLWTVSPGRSGFGSREL